MLDDAVDGNESIDDTVHNFISVLKSVVNPFCAQTVTKQTCKCENEKSRRNHISDKPWFTEECKTLYRKYKYELRQFNKFKTKVNRLRLADAKKAYKRVNIRQKRIFLRTEGNMITHMKRENPKLFYKMFKKRKRHDNSSLTADDFKSFFEQLMKSNTEKPENDPDVDSDEYTFEELDCDIQIDEVLHEIKKLKTTKPLA